MLRLKKGRNASVRCEQKTSCYVVAGVTKWQEYEREKERIRAMNLPHIFYEKAIKSY